ncbi:MAG: two-component regulator propeller domain-containing protein, partial [Rhodothermales bacterium]|nr:two-component regulator propeller domain-containing protein [Rhodothermales bacterium]
QAGLNRFDRETRSFTAYFHEPGDPSSLIDSQVRAIIEDSQGRFWVGTWGDGLHTMDRETGTFTRHLYDPENPTSLSRPHLKDDPGRGGVNFIHEDRDGIIWIGAVNGGLNRYDPSTGVVSHFEGDADDPNSLGENRVWTVFESRDGTLWIGTLGGLHRVDASVGQFPHYSIGPTDFDNATRSITEDVYGNVWLGASSGLHLMSPAGDGSGEYRYRGEVPQSLGAVRIHSLLADRAGQLWIGTWEQGLYRYDQSSRRLTHFDVSDPGFLSLAGLTIMALHEDESGLIWIGTGTQGLFRYDPSSEHLTAFTHDPDDPESLGQNSIRCLFETADGILWVGSDGGLSSFDRATERFRTYVYAPGEQTSLSDNVVTALWEDTAGRLWVGTESGGLNRMDRSRDTFARLTTADSGLPADGILGITEDDDGDLWISTDRGLTRLDPETGTFDSFGSDYGLPAEPFYAGSVHRSRDGRLFFGGRNGFHTFRPRAIHKEDDPLPPQIAITRFALFGQLVGPEPGSPLDRAITEADEISLSHFQNDVTFGFAALHYRRP